MNYAFAPIKDLRRALDAKEISSVELAKFFLDRIKKFDADLNSFITVCEEEALAEAHLADKRIGAKKQGPLTGIPYASKDLFATRGVRTTAASKILENYVPPFDATVTKKLRDAGAVLLGKTNLVI